MKTINWNERGGPGGCGLLVLLPLLAVLLLWLGPIEADPDDAPGDDCPDHGPYDDEECPKCD
jgi:hypothetical protein